MPKPITTSGRSPTLWTRLPVALRAILTGLVVFAISANVWPVLLLKLGTVPAAVVEVIFLALLLWWSHGGGPPRAAKAFRAKTFRSIRLTPGQWIWGFIAAIFFAATVHASIVLLFRFVPYPAAEFRRGYDLSFIPTRALRWVAVVVSAASAGICEEIGFRGFMQQPIEERHGVSTAVFTSSLLFMAVHLTKAWALVGMVPIVFGAGALLGLLARFSGSLIPGILGHFIMDVGMFAYWWTGIAGNFTSRPIGETGMNGQFLIACCVFGISLGIVLVALSRLRRVAAASA